MSILAIFRVIKKDKLDEYCRMARLLPKAQAKKRQEEKGQGVGPGFISLRMVTPAEMKSAEFQKSQQYYTKLHNYLRQNSQQPFQYEWSGSVVYELISSLKETDNIDLFTNELVDDEGSSNWVIDKELKDKYFKRLAPSNFSESKLKFEYMHHQGVRPIVPVVA